MVQMWPPYMAVLEALVIATLILTGAWVGYNYWEYSLTHDKYGGEAHDTYWPPYMSHQQVPIASVVPLTAGG